MKRTVQGGSPAALALGGLLLAGSVWGQTSPQRFSFDPSASEIHWRVYKAGAFARFGHNHVISVAEPHGGVALAAAIEDSRVEIEIPVLDLVVDDPALRGRYGEDFASEPSADDIAGTHRNMLTEAVLNGEQFSHVRLVGTNLSGADGAQTIDLAITLLGRTVNVTVPLDLRIAEDAVVAHGEFRLTHEQLGMTPFSVMMGALQVANEIDFTFHVRAVRAGTDPSAR